MQKKKILDVIFVFMLLVAVFFCCFFQKLNYGFNNFLLNKNIISVNNKFSVHFLNVGEANAVAFKLPNGEVGLIDAGSEDTSLKVYNYLKNNLIEKNTLDYLILTHTDSDHIAGALKILNNFNVLNILIPNIPENIINSKDIYNKFKELVNNECLNGATFNYIFDGLNFSINKANFSFLGPLGDYSNENNYSPLIKLKYGDYTFMFTGDMQSDAENDLILKYGQELKCDVLMVAHHGAKTSNSYEFLKLTDAKYAVISVGNNAYGHPDIETIKNLQMLDFDILSTEVNNNICFIVDNQNLQLLSGELNFVYYDIKLFYILIVYLSILAFIGINRLRKICLI